MPRYVFTLMKNGQPIESYIGDYELPPEVVAHEFSTRQMRNILSDHGYKLQFRV